MKVTMMLADSAQAVQGKLYVLGGGWSVTGPDSSPFAIALKLEVPWNQANQKHSWKLELVTEDGGLVTVSTPDGEKSFTIEAEFEVGRPAGLPPGTPIDHAAALNFGPLPIPAGGRYVWRLSVDGFHDEDWELGFTMRKPQSAAA